MPQNRGSGVKIGSKIALGSALKAWHVPIEVPTTSQAIEERFQGSRYGRIHYTVHTFGDGMGLAPKAMVYHFYGRLWYRRSAVPMVNVWAIALYRCMLHGVRRTPCVLWYTHDGGLHTADHTHISYTHRYVTYVGYSCTLNTKG